MLTYLSHVSLQNDKLIMEIEDQKILDKIESLSASIKTDSGASLKKSNDHDYRSNSDTGGSAARAESTAHSAKETAENTSKENTSKKTGSDILLEGNSDPHDYRGVHAARGSVPSLAQKENKILYFIIDDAGYNLEKLKPFLDFPGDITIAVLPGLPYSKQSAELALKKGKKIILHQPMESTNNNNTGPHAIKSGMEENEIIEILEHNINSIPGIVGINNHMGSAITADERIIKIILEYLYNNNLFFIDSRTTHDSICKKVAANSGYAIMERDVFLDNTDEKKAIMESINAGKSIAKKKGYAVMIGHAWSAELADILLQIYPTLIEEGFTIKNPAP